MSTPSHAHDRMAASTPLSTYPAQSGYGQSGQFSTHGHASTQPLTAAKVKVVSQHDRSFKVLLERVKESRLSRGGVSALEAFQRRCEEDTYGSGYLSEPALQRVFDDCNVAL